MALKPLVSVIMPVFNTERYVREAVESVIAQTYPNWELVVVDDGSTDRSRHIVMDQVTSSASPIRLVTHPGGQNLGLSASRNRGFDFASGEYITYLDSDDKWYPDKLEQQVELALRHPDVALFVGATHYWHPDDRASDLIIPVGGPQNQIVHPPMLFDMLYPIGPGAAPSVNTILARRNALIQFGGWEDQFRRYEDQAFLIKFYLASKVYISSSAYDMYRQNRPGSIMSTELAGHRYFLSRRLFLLWLNDYMKRNSFLYSREIAIVRAMLDDKKLRMLSTPSGYWFIQNIQRLIAKSKRTIKG